MNINKMKGDFTMARTKKSKLFTNFENIVDENKVKETKVEKVKEVKEEKPTKQTISKIENKKTKVEPKVESLADFLY